MKNRARVVGAWRGVAALLVGWGPLGCGPATPPPDAPPPPLDDEGGGADGDVPAAEADKLETGKDCVDARATCDAGMCKATVKNDCKEAVTCEMTMMVLCRDEVKTGEAKGRNRDTFAAGTTKTLEAGANCEGAVMVATTAEGMTCK